MPPIPLSRSLFIILKGIYRTFSFYLRSLEHISISRFCKRFSRNGPSSGHRLKFEKFQTEYEQIMYHFLKHVIWRILIYSCALNREIQIFYRTLLLFKFLSPESRDLLCFYRRAFLYSTILNLKD